MCILLHTSHWQPCHTNVAAAHLFIASFAWLLLFSGLIVPLPLHFEHAIVPEPRHLMQVVWGALQAGCCLVMVTASVGLCLRRGCQQQQQQQQQGAHPEQ